MKRAYIPLACAATALILSASISPAWSYFTDHSWASGGQKINVKPTTTVEETFGNREKKLTIKNTGDNDVDVFVRARAYASESLTIEGSGWTDGGDGWWYYGSNPAGMTPIACGASANELTVRLDFPKNAKENDEYNVVVIYESTHAQYDADGNTNPDWDYILDRSSVEGGN